MMGFDGGGNHPVQFVETFAFLAAGLDPHRGCEERCRREGFLGEMLSTSLHLPMLNIRLSSIRFLALGACPGVAGEGPDGLLDG